jgi:hypothetical protein
MHPGAASWADDHPGGVCGDFCGDCGPGCRLFGDFVFPFCDLGQPDVDDLSCIVDGYDDIDDCPLGDIVSPLDDPCEPVPCKSDGQCAALFGYAVPCRGGYCQEIDVDDLVAEIYAFGANPPCPHPCPPAIPASTPSPPTSIRRGSTSETSMPPR